MNTLFNYCGHSKVDVKFHYILVIQFVQLNWLWNFYLKRMNHSLLFCMFVFHLINRARWRENRTIFNTPNPRLMNVSLLRENKLMHSQERRGSRMSMRMPSRQPSMVSLRPHSPNPSIGRQGLYNNGRTVHISFHFDLLLLYSILNLFLPSYESNFE